MYYDKKVGASMHQRKKLDFNLTLKSIDSSGTFAGYASVFNVVDNQRDIIARGAFSHTLKGRVGDIKLLWQHQQDEPIGIFTTIFEDTLGLYVEAKLLLTVQRAQGHEDGYAHGFVGFKLESALHHLGLQRPGITALYAFGKHLALSLHRCPLAAVFHLLHLQACRTFFTFPWHAPFELVAIQNTPVKL